MSTSREAHTRQLALAGNIDNVQRAYIKRELALVEKYMLDRSAEIGMLNVQANTTSPMHWQVFSRFEHSIPESAFISEERVLDIIGYLVMRLADARRFGTAEWTQSVAEEPLPKPAPARKKLPKRNRGGRKLPKKEGA